MMVKFGDEKGVIEDNFLDVFFSFVRVKLLIESGMGLQRVTSFLTHLMFLSCSC